MALSFSSMTMCGLIHASILKMGRSYVTEEEEAEFIHHCRAFALRQASSRGIHDMLIGVGCDGTAHRHHVLGASSV